jgi:polyhydroxybutyrate depolymerase
MKVILPLGVVALLFAWEAVAAAPCPDLHPGLNRISVVSGGKPRSFEVALPDSAEQGSVPLVIGLHGSGGSGAGLEERTGLRAAGIAKGFAVMLPDGGIRTQRPDGSSGYFWNIPGVPLVDGRAVPDTALDDIRFIADAIDHLTKQGCVDGRKVYVTGMSGGGRMASMLGCRLADRIAAIAPVAGLRAGRAAAPDFDEPETNDCRPARPLSVLSFHGTDDEVNPFPGGLGVRWGYSVERAAVRWASLDGCSATPAIEKVSANLSRIRYGACKAGKEVVLYRINASREQGGGHIWPGEQSGGGVSATELMLDFFSRH